MSRGSRGFAAEQAMFILVVAKAVENIFALPFCLQNDMLKPVIGTCTQLILFGTKGFFQSQVKSKHFRKPNPYKSYLNECRSLKHVNNIQKEKQL